MRSDWSSLLLVAGILTVVFFAFNYPGSQQLIPFEKLFPDEKPLPPAPDSIVYEFVDRSGNVYYPPSPMITLDTAGKKNSSRSAAKPSVAPQVKTSSARKESRPTPVLSPPVSEKAASVAVPVTTGNYFTVHIASHPQRDTAQTQVNKLQAAGHAALIIQRDLGAKGTWYRVYVGKFADHDEAEASLPKLKSSFPDAYVISVLP